MKEHYVSYECAVKLKDLGFSGEVTGKYVDCPNDPTLFHGMLYQSWNLENDEILAPRLDQAAAWLREVKGIDIEPRVWLIGNKREYSPYVMPPKCKDYIAYPPEDSYEKALESGISKALELLGKEVKNA